MASVTILDEGWISVRRDDLMALRAENNLLRGQNGRLLDENIALREAFMFYIRADNNCHEPCTDQTKCGCAVEMDQAVQQELHYPANEQQR